MTRSVDPDPEHDAAYLEFVHAINQSSWFADVLFVHPRTWWKSGIRHLADTSEMPRIGAGGQFFVIAPCHEMHHLHRALREDLGPVTCLLCLMQMVTSDL